MDFVGDILIEEERIAKVGAHLKDSPIAQGAKLLDAGGLCAAPGFLDIDVYKRQIFYQCQDFATENTAKVRRLSKQSGCQRIP